MTRKDRNFPPGYLFGLRRIRQGAYLTCEGEIVLVIAHDGPRKALWHRDSKGFIETLKELPEEIKAQLFPSSIKVHKQSLKSLPHS